MRLLVVGAALLVSAVVHGAQPDVVSTSPVRNTMAPATTAISITFDEPLLTSSITSSSFRVFGRASGTASGTIAFSNGNATLTLTPSHPFSAGERVLVNLSHDVRAADSTPLRSAGYAFEFTIQSAPAGMKPVFLKAVKPGEETFIDHYRRQHADPAERPALESEIMRS